MEGAGAEAGWLASCHEVATPVLLGRGWWAEASHGLTATRRESTVEWVAGEAESLKVRPEFLFTGDVCVDRLSSLLVSSLSFEEMGFLGKEGKANMSLCGLGCSPILESSMIPSEELCFQKGMETKK